MDNIDHDRVVEPEEDTGWASPSSLLHWATLPRLALKLTRACHSPQTEYSQLCALLQYDPAQLCRYLFALQSTASTPDHRPIRQRFDRGDKSVLSRTVICTPRLDELFPEQSLPMAEEFLSQHWIESLQSAFLCRAFARVMELPNSEEAFFAGLLYRIGELVLLAQEKQDYLSLMLQHADPLQRRRLEREHYQINASLLGKQVLQQLHLPQSWLDAALFCDQPTDRILTAHPVTRLVHVAHQIVSGRIAKFRDAQRLMHQVLNLHHEHGEMLLESALNQSFDVLESLGVQCPPEWLRQKLLPLPPEEHSPAALESDLQQLRVERIQIKNILSSTIWLDYHGGEQGLQEHLKQSAYLLFGSHQLLLFRYDTRLESLVGDSSATDDHFESALSIPLALKSLATDCLRDQNAIASFNRPAAELSVIDLELMQYCKRQYLVALPISEERQKWGCMVLAFDHDIQNRFNMWQGPLLFFAQQVYQALTQRDNRRHWLQDTAQFERKMFEHQFKRTAHEINNPLTIAQNHLSILRNHRTLDIDADEHINVAIEQIDSASRILHASVERMSRPTTRLNAVNINELIQDILYLFYDQDGQETNIVRSLDERLPTIYIDENYLRQVLINLIKNAMESCDEGNTISVTTRRQVNIQGCRHVAIQIQDDGPGLSDSLLDTLFSDALSQKKGHHGGLGLAIVKDLVEEMGGLISFQRLDDSHSTFTVYLPIQANR